MIFSNLFELFFDCFFSRLTDSSPLDQFEEPRKSVEFRKPQKLSMISVLIRVHFEQELKWDYREKVHSKPQFEVSFCDFCVARDQDIVYIKWREED